MNDIFKKNLLIHQSAFTPFILRICLLEVISRASQSVLYAAVAIKLTIVATFGMGKKSQFFDMVLNCHCQIIFLQNGRLQLKDTIPVFKRNRISHFVCIVIFHDVVVINLRDIDCGMVSIGGE